MAEVQSKNQELQRRVQQMAFADAKRAGGFKKAQSVEEVREFVAKLSCYNPGCSHAQCGGDKPDEIGNLFKEICGVDRFGDDWTMAHLEALARKVFDADPDPEVVRGCFEEMAANPGDGGSRQGQVIVSYSGNPLRVFGGHAEILL
eukprot:COSAG04_NODE_8102_length_1023_cov_1.053030_1_plen_146_part_00